MSVDWTNLAAHARIVHSQHGEDGILEHIFGGLGVECGFFVDIGASDGVSYSNVRALRDRGWSGVAFDMRAHGESWIRREYVTEHNVCELLREAGAPVRFDLLSIDIDGHDFWVLRALLRKFLPKVIVAEVSGGLPRWPAVTVPPFPPHIEPNTEYMGMSLGALEMIAKRRGYRLVLLRGNAYLVRADLLPWGLEFEIQFTPQRGHPMDQLFRPWHAVTSGDLE